MTKEGGLFETATLHLYIKGHTNNYCGCAFNSLKVMYRKQNVFTFEKCYEIFNTRNNVEVIQMFHENFFDLESFLDDLYDRPDPKIVNINHVLQVKRSWHTLVMVKSSIMRHGQNTIKKRTIPTATHKGRESL